MPNVFACIDASPSAAAVCDYAAWASAGLGVPLTLLHVLDVDRYPAAGDLSGSIGLGAREQLLEELAELDAKRGRLALEQGRLMLEAAKQRVLAHGVENVTLRQRHGDLVESLGEVEAEIRLLVMGRQGDRQGHYVGSHVESVLRTLRRPILITPAGFEPPRSVMLAFDGSATTRKSVELLAASPLLRDLPVHVVTIGQDSDDNREALEWARRQLLAAGIETHIAIRAGEVEPALHAYQAEHGLDLLVMGAYGHSRIREFLVGSTTTALLRSARSPLLILR